MSSTSQVLNNCYYYIQTYIQNNSGTLIWGSTDQAPCSSSNFTYDCNSTSLTIHTWAYSFTQPTLSILQTIPFSSVQALINSNPI